MDRGVEHSASSSKNFIKSAEMFEKDIKERLNWNKSQWISAGENGSRFNRLCSSLHYWKSKLKPAVESNSIVFTLFNREKDVKVELIDVINTLESLDVDFTVKGFANFRNPRYLCLYFDSQEIRDRVKSQFRMMNDSYIVYMSWALENVSAVTVLKVHWLPMTMNIDIIKKELDTYVTFIEEERKKFKFMSGREMTCGRVSFKVILKKDILAENVPHVKEIGKMEALITIVGRKPLCLNCETLGHISRDCKVRFCNYCRALKPKGHTCDTNEFCSYADKVKQGGEEKAHSIHEEWGAEIVVEPHGQSLIEAQALAKKITELESKIKSAEVTKLEQDFLKREKKRKGDGSEAATGGDSISSDSSVEYMEDEEDESDVEDLTTGLKNGEMKQSLNPKVIREVNSDIDKTKKNKNCRKKKKKANPDNSGSDVNKEKGNKIDASVLGKKEESFRSYGRPVYNNVRRLNEQKKFDKLTEKSPEKREFIFDD